MAIGVSFISFIIPIENIEKHYPGGFKQYKSERNYIIHDNFIIRIITINPTAKLLYLQFLSDS